MVTPVPNRAGMVCFNRVGEILLVSALGKPNVWVFPKGHIEQGEELWETAEREVREEAGIIATAEVNAVGRTSYSYKGEDVIVEWIPGYAIGLVDGWEGREVRWVQWKLALDMLTFPDLRGILCTTLCLSDVYGGDRVVLTDSRDVMVSEKED